MWDPRTNWQPQSSYQQPVAIPSAGITDSPTVCIQINASWIPYVCGALMQLVQPKTWDTADPVALSNAQIAATELIELVGTATAGSCATWPEQVWLASYSTNILLRNSPTDPDLPVNMGLAPFTGGTLFSVRKVAGAYWLSYPAVPLLVQIDVFGSSYLELTAPAHPWYGIEPVGSGAWACTFSSTGIAVLNSTGGVSSYITHTGMNTPYVMATDVNGRIWVVNSNGSPGVLVFNPDGTFFGSYTPSGGYEVLGVGRVDHGGNSYMWVTDYAQNKIYELTPLLVLNATFTPGITTMRSPCQVGSNVWLGTDGGNIYTLSTAGVLLSTDGVAGLSLCNSILHVPAGP